MDLIIRPDNTAQWRGRTIRCALGRGGIRDDKREGDGATPSGDYTLVRVLYRADRGPRPTTHLPVASIEPADGWCDAPRDPLYNRQVHLPYPASAESLWREDRVYDLIAVTDHNADPVVAGVGSAIFVHLARPDFGPTAGCIAFELADLRRLLAEWRAGDRLRIRPL
jgi:L,D-peptidoglycan transpeptidase YkuD (ErfK/YbiS/YcfS/YnhG family)